MEASLTCAVCLGLFEDPVTLPLCSHNFCKGCVLECLASGEPGPLPSPRAGQGQRFSCPLCRKLCPLPLGGYSALPVNTTLAEVVKLYRAGGGKAGPGRGEAGALSPPPAFGAACEKHPARLVQLYCRMCRQAGCGQCVSEEHQGIFHAVNLLDTVYQEEKLTFFSSLKKLRAINENLVKELSSHPKDTEVKDIEGQRSKKEREYQIWKKMKETHKKTIESFLKDCEKLVDECDPECFLEVACGLNKRMKTQLDLMHIASSYEKAPESTQKQMDIKSVVNEVLALQLTSVDPCIVKELSSGGNEGLTGKYAYKNSAKQWKDQKSIHNTYYPVVGHEETLTDGSKICTRLMSISEMSTFQNMSHEEVRYNYYMGHRTSDQLKMQTSPANTKHTFVITDSSKDMFSAVPLLSSPPKVKDAQRIRTQKLQKGSFSNTSFSSSSSYRFSFPPVNWNFSELNSDLKLFNGTRSPEVSKLTSPSENFNGLVIKNKVKMAQSSPVPISAKTLASLSTSTGLPESATNPVPVSKPTFLGAPTQSLSAPHFIPNSGNNSTLPNLNKAAATFFFKKEKNNSVFPTFYVGRCDTQDEMGNQHGNCTKFNSSALTEAKASAASTSSKLESSESGKPVFSFTSSNSERDCFTVSKLSNSLKISPFSSLSEKPAEQSTIFQTGKENVSVSKDVEYNWLKSTVVPQEQSASTPDSTAIVACTTSSSDTGKKDVSKTQPLPCNNIFSFSSNNCILECKSSPVISFEGTVKNTSNSLSSSSMLFLSNNNKSEKMKIESIDKAHPVVEKSTPPICTVAISELTSPKRSNSFFSFDLSMKTETEDTLAQQNSLCGPAVVSSLFSTGLPSKESNVFSTHPSAASTKPHIDVKVEDNVNIAETYKSHQDLEEISRKEDELDTLQLQNATCLTPVTCDTFLGGSAHAVDKERETLNHSDSDIEELSQASMSSDCSSASEYFLVAEDTITASEKPGQEIKSTSIQNSWSEM
ncbi:alcohol dehydrogenase 1-like [Platysternon megacephalum]|uniref:Alcohol dehydrogenase 1-like n=1 Tax=Platysternon megacephalum TaxID=55544 RepID=A0A4D9FA27_9SAUR|nr:alcohol dehydrogenase 1-like [Platysternon megacephalum]